MTRGVNRGRPLGRSRSEPAAFAVVPTSLIIQYAHRWYRFGGGDAEDIMTLFGWTAERFFSEVRSSLLRSPPSGIPPAECGAMIAVCTDRLASRAWPASGLSNATGGS